MPEYLTLDGVPIPCSAPGGGGLLEPERSGELIRMHDNSLVSTENPAQLKRVWQFATKPLTASEWAVIWPMLRGGALHTAAGYAITRGAGSASVLPVLQDVTHEPDGDTDFRYRARFLLREAFGLAEGGTISSFALSDLVSPDDDGSGSYPITVTGATGQLNLAEPTARVNYTSRYATAGVVTPCAPVGCPPGGCADTITAIQRWRTRLLNPGLLDGVASAWVLSSFAQSFAPWSRVSLSGYFDVIRAGAIVAGPYQCALAFPPFFGGGCYIPTLSPIAFALLLNDQVEFTLTTVLALKNCVADPGTRPLVLYGWQYSNMALPGLITEA